MTAPSAAPSPPTSWPLPTAAAPDRSLVGVAAAVSAGAGLIHVGLAGAHAEHHVTMGVAFLLTGLAQLAWSAALPLRWSRPALLAGAAVHLAAIAGLAMVTSVGWPFGPQAGVAEQVSTAALICLVLELAAVGAVVSLLGARVRLPALAQPTAWVAVVAATAGALLIGASHDAAGAGLAGQHHAGTATAAAAVAPVVGAAGTGAASHDDSGPHGEAGHDGDQSSAGAPAGAAPAPAAAHGHAPADTTPPTADQQRAADALLAASQTTLKRYALASVAEAEGYRVVHDADGKLLHYLNPAYASDGRAVDPTRIESLLYVVLPGGGKLLVGGMFTMPKGERGPSVGGSLTQWHAHDDLCLDPAKGMAITQLPGGGCPPGSAVGATGEMMHVWAIDYPGGPFGELDAAMLMEAVLDVYGIGVQPVSG